MYMPILQGCNLTRDMVVNTMHCKISERLSQELEEEFGDIHHGTIGLL